MQPPASLAAASDVEFPGRRAAVRFKSSLLANTSSRSQLAREDVRYGRSIFRRTVARKSSGHSVMCVCVCVCLYAHTCGPSLSHDVRAREDVGHAQPGRGAHVMARMKRSSPAWGTVPQVRSAMAVAQARHAAQVACVAILGTTGPSINRIRIRIEDRIGPSRRAKLRSPMACSHRRFLFIARRALQRIILSQSQELLCTPFRLFSFRLLTFLSPPALVSFFLSTNSFQ